MSSNFGLRYPKICMFLLTLRWVWCLTPLSTDIKYFEISNGIFFLNKTKFFLIRIYPFCGGLLDIYFLRNLKFLHFVNHVIIIKTKILLPLT